MKSVKPVYPYKLSYSVLPIQIAVFMPVIRYLISIATGGNAVWDQDMTMSLLVFGLIDVIYLLMIFSGWAKRLDLEEDRLTIHRVLGRPVRASFSELSQRNGRLWVGRRFSIDLVGMTNAHELELLLHGRVTVKKGSRIRLSHIAYAGLALIVIFIPVSVALGLESMIAFILFYGVIGALVLGMVVFTVRRLLVH